MLPAEVLEQVKKDLPVWNGLGYSAMEISHRSAEFSALLDQIESDLRSLMRIPDDYSVLLVQGGATLQFSLLPMNLLHGRETADYLTTGSWSSKAFKEARKANSNVHEAATGAQHNFMSLPERDEWQLSPEAVFLHYVHNETIAGLMFPSIPDVDVPVISDLSSCILSLDMDVSRMGAFYAGVQKNMGPAGLAVLVMAPELLERCRDNLPDMLSYRAYARNRSILNTPPTFTCYVLGLVLRWVSERGGVKVMHRNTVAKSDLLYGLIDQSELYANPIQKSARSITNIAFTLADPALDEKFLQQAERRSLVSLKGHRSVGGMRASLYNGMPMEGVQALHDFMLEFERDWQKGR